MQWKIVVNLIEKGKKKALPPFLKSIVPWEDQMEVQLILHEGIKKRKTETLSVFVLLAQVSCRLCFLGQAQSSLSPGPHLLSPLLSPFPLPLPTS